LRRNANRLPGPSAWKRAGDVGGELSKAVESRADERVHPAAIDAPVVVNQEIRNPARLSSAAAVSGRITPASARVGRLSL
jgi:hypothetical protein